MRSLYNPMALVYFDVENFRAPKNKTNAISYDLSVFLFFDLMIDFFFSFSIPFKVFEEINAWTECI